MGRRGEKDGFAGINIKGNDLAIIFMSLLIATILQLRKLTQKLDDLLHDPGRMVKEFATGIIPALVGGFVVGAKKTWNNRDKSKGGRE